MVSACLVPAFPALPIPPTGDVRRFSPDGIGFVEGVPVIAVISASESSRETDPPEGVLLIGRRLEVFRVLARAIPATVVEGQSWGNGTHEPLIGEAVRQIAPMIGSPFPIRVVRQGTGPAPAALWLSGENDLSRPPLKGGSHDQAATTSMFSRRYAETASRTLVDREKAKNTARASRLLFGNPA